MVKREMNDALHGAAGSRLGSGVIEEALAAMPVKLQF
jgi:hypothetical protein